MDFDLAFLNQALLQAGYYAPPIPIMAVPKNKPRIRFFVSAAHTPADITGVLDVLAAAMASCVHRADGVHAEATAGLHLGA